MTKVDCGHWMISDQASVADFFEATLGINPSKDLRGILWGPSTCDIVSGSPITHGTVEVAVAFNGFVGKTCAMHVVIQKPGSLSRSMLKAAFGYAFDTCGVVNIFGLVDSENQAAIALNKRLGFKELNRISDSGIDGDLIIFMMSKSECPWIRKSRNGIQTTAASA